MEKIHGDVHVFVLLWKFVMCNHIFSPFSACLYPHYIIMDKGL